MIAQDTLINVIEGESVLLNLKSESYFGLDPIQERPDDYQFSSHG